MEDSFALSQGDLDLEVSFADGSTPYQPDMVVLGDFIGVKIGSLVMIFRPDEG
jgi:hypothetical protein